MFLVDVLYWAIPGESLPPPISTSELLRKRMAKLIVKVLWEALSQLG